MANVTKINGNLINAATASFAISASWAPSVASNPFPFTGSALITGSLGVTGSTSIRGSFIQGSASSATGLFAHAQGFSTIAQGIYSHAEGYLSNTFTSAGYSHAEGFFTLASGSYSHAEGQSTTSIGFYSHAEGQGTTTQGDNSHAEGEGTLAIGIASHAEGQSTTASADYSHTEGNSTQTVSTYQHAQGQFNLPTSGSGAFIIGNGTAGNARSNLVFASGSQFQITGSLNVSGSSTITSTLTVGSSSLGPSENTITLGARDTTSEGGQIGFNAPGGTYTSASMIDLYQNRLRILKGTNAGSTAEVAWWSMHNLQMALPGYNSATAFTGSEVAALGVDSSGNILTTTVPGAILTNNYIGAGFTNPIVTYMPFGAATVSGAESQRQVASPVAGTIKNFYIRTNNTSPAGGTTTFTIRVNGVATNVKITIGGSLAAGKFSDTTNSASVAVGDDISLQVSTSVANSPQINQYSLGIYPS